MKLTVAVGGHESSAELTAEQVALLDLLIIEGATARLRSAGRDARRRGALGGRDPAPGMAGRR